MGDLNLNRNALVKDEESGRLHLGIQEGDWKNDPSFEQEVVRRRPNLKRLSLQGFDIIMDDALLPSSTKNLWKSDEFDENDQLVDRYEILSSSGSE